jgi:hypothetical protein
VVDGVGELEGQRVVESVGQLVGELEGVVE